MNIINFTRTHSTAHPNLAICASPTHLITNGSWALKNPTKETTCLQSEVDALLLRVFSSPSSQSSQAQLYTPLSQECHLEWPNNS